MRPTVGRAGSCVNGSTHEVAGDAEEQSSGREVNQGQTASPGRVSGAGAFAQGPMSDHVDRTFDPRDGPLAKTARYALAESEC